MTSGSMIVFALDERRFGLPLDTVERVVHVVEILPLPKAPDIVCGVFNVQGRIIPVVDVRKRFSLPDKAVALTDQLLIARARSLTVALRVDAVVGIDECGGPNVTLPEDVVSGLEHISGIAKRADGMVLIHDLEQFLSLEEERGLDRALAVAAGGD